MRIWITKPWPPLQIVLLKWCCLLFGVAVGVWFAPTLRPHLLWILIAAVLLALGPVIHYFRKTG